MSHTLYQTHTQYRRYHDTTAKPPKHAIFVFATNSRGYHNTSTSRTAVEAFGASMYQGHGLSGNSYAIPVWDSDGRPLRYSAYSTHIEQFIDHAKINNDRIFWLTDICGAIGIKLPIILDLFADAPMNCIFPSNWQKTY